MSNLGGTHNERFPIKRTIKIENDANQANATSREKSSDRQPEFNFPHWLHPSL